MDPSIPDDCMINSLIEKHGDVWVCTRCGKTAHDARTKANLKRHIEVKQINKGHIETWPHRPMGPIVWEYGILKGVMFLG